MATNSPKDDGYGNGVVRGRSQTKTSSGHYVKRENEDGRFMDSWMLKTSEKHHIKACARKSSLTINNLSEIGKIQ